MSFSRYQDRELLKKLTSNESSRFDKLGYYTVGGFKTYSKIEAIELQQVSKKNIVWHFNHDVFGSYDWKVEPLESLEELYARRARELREQYDYITIFYSGGADSGNVLNSFVNNGIPIDEIATYNFHSVDDRKDNFFHAEQYQVSYPRIQELQARGIKFKHKKIDLSEIGYFILTDPSINNNLAYLSNGHFGITHLAISYIRERDPEYRRLVDQGKKHAFIWAVEKPRVYHENGKYVMRFLDIVDSGPSTRTQILKRDYEYDELFYWDPSCCDLLCKQAHVLMRYMKKNTELLLADRDLRNESALFSFPGKMSNIFQEDSSDDGLSYREILNWLIYPGYDPAMFSMGKPLSSIYSLRDENWLKDIILRQNIDKMVSHLIDVAKPWFKDEKTINHGLRALSSPPYFLE